LPLNPPRRIFGRKKRHSPAVIALRSVVVFLFGVSAALGATLVAAKWPEGRGAPGRDLAAVSLASGARMKARVIRVAVAATRHAADPTGGIDRDAPRKP